MIRTPDGPLLEKVFGTQTRRSTDSVSAILRSLVAEHGFDRRADVAVCLPAQTVSFVEVQTDAAGLQALRAGETLKLQNDLPIPVEDAIIQICSARTLPENKYDVVLAATAGDTVREQLRLLEEGNIHPSTVDAPILATQATLAANHPDTMTATTVILCVDESILTLAVMQEGTILIVRNIPVVCDDDWSLSVEQTAEIIEREVEITWRKLFGAGPDGNLYILLAATSKAVEQLVPAIREKIECRIAVVDPYARVKKSGDVVDADLSMSVAVGLALRALVCESRDPCDFLAAYNIRTRPGSRLKRELIVCTSLVVITAGIWFLGLFVRLSALESEYAGLKGRIQTVFRQALPQEKNIVDPLAQLQQKLDAVRDEYKAASSFGPGRFSPLEIWHMLATHTPKDGNLKFHDLTITTDFVQAVGSCDSFAVISEWQRLLKQIPGFDTVHVQDQKIDARTGQVQFTLSMASARTGS
jgi:Tfp pilus assembly PilM family ATPase